MVLLEIFNPVYFLQQWFCQFLLLVIATVTEHIYPEYRSFSESD